jgi:hypothetical protein
MQERAIRARFGVSFPWELLLAGQTMADSSGVCHLIATWRCDVARSVYPVTPGQRRGNGCPVSVGSRNCDGLRRTRTLTQPGCDSGEQIMAICLPAWATPSGVMWARPAWATPSGVMWARPAWATPSGVMWARPWWARPSRRSAGRASPWWAAPGGVRRARPWWTVPSQPERGVPWWARTPTTRRPPARHWWAEARLVAHVWARHEV